MSEFSIKLDQARERLPFRRLIESYGSICPWCGQKSAKTAERVEKRGRIAAEDVERVRTATDIVALIGASVELKKAGSAFVGLCPFHQEKNGSFNVVPSKHMFHCFGCQESGSAIDWLTKRSNLSFREACEQLASQNGISLRYEVERKRQYFTCVNPDCESRTHTKADHLDEVDYLARQLNLSNTEAAYAYMREAGVIKEAERTAPSVMPGQQRRSLPLPKVEEPGTVAKPEAPIVPPPPEPASQTPAPSDPDDEEIIQQCIEVIRVEGKASVSLLQRRLRLGYGRAARIMDELEGRGIVGPAKGAEPREILINLDAVPPAAPETPPALVALPMAPKPVVACTSKRGEAMCGQPATWKHPNYLEGAFCDECKKMAEALYPNNWLALVPAAPEAAAVPAATAGEPTFSKIANDDELAGALDGIKKLKSKIGVNKAFGKDVTKYETMLKAAEETVAAYETQKKIAKATALKAERNGRSELGLGYAALQWFYDQLKLSEEDEKMLWFKRGLCSATAIALGYRSSVKTNRELLVAMKDLFDLPELFASGLWLRANEERKKEARPNSQFCGAGRMRKLKPGEKPSAGQWKDEDDFLWGWCEPVLIPYRDDLGRLISLRPHKGMGSAGSVVGTPHVYFPRVAPVAEQKKPLEQYRVVVITEGEFKAAAIWQTLGKAGFVSNDPVGVCAVPGINFAKHFEVREELDAWLSAVGCRCVKVGFDDEDKSDKPMSKRHDSQIWARYLATDLAQKLHCRGEIIVLPKEWREGKKADWDGGLAKIVHAKKTEEGDNLP